METFRKIVFQALLLFVLPLSMAQAAIISYTTTFLGGAQWRYDYAITNDSLPLLEEFTIWFSPLVYGNLSNASGPAGWDLLLVQPDPNLPADGFLDGLALGGGIPPLATVAGFSVTFDYLGTGTPGAQPFSIVDPLSFEELDSGMTTSATEVPLPGVAWLMAGGAAAMLAELSRALPKKNTNANQGTCDYLQGDAS